MSEEQPQTTSAGGSASGEPGREGLSSSSERIELIIEAAERAAAGIIEDAESQARRYLEDSRRRADEIADERGAALSDLADSLMKRAENVKQQSADLIAALEDARVQIADRLGADLQMPALDGAALEADSAPAPPAPVKAAPPEPAPVSDAPTEEPEPVEEPPVEEPAAASEPESKPEPPPPPKRVVAPGAPASAGARLLATQMAVAGSSRDEIANRLENEFGIADSRAMLDGILGPES
jgi:vacuolar-type H+-ATPase subunit H